MPIIKSAKKRVKVSRKQTSQNVRTKKNFRTAIKALHAAISGGAKVDEAQKKAQSAIDTAVKKGVISKNKAARQKSRLNAQAKAAGSSKPKAAAKKAPAKKPAAKKTAKK